jgi:hypothetical protein
MLPQNLMIDQLLTRLELLASVPKFLIITPVGLLETECYSNQLILRIEALHHREYRVPSFLSLQSCELAPPAPSPQTNVMWPPPPPPPGPGGGGATPGGGGGGGGPK